MTALLGLVMIYSWGHLIFLIGDIAYRRMSSYEKVVTWVATLSFALYVLGTINS